MDLDKWLEQVRRSEYLPEKDMKKLCRIAIEILIDEPNVVKVNAPVTICGDIHGQFHDLLELFKTGGEVPDTSYIFMGDFVDRGHNSLETLTLLLLLKVRWPAHMTLLRGNHETRTVTTIYGFFDECNRKYGNSSVWRACTEVFDCMSISALVGNSILCVHGGLSPNIQVIDQILTIQRKQEIPNAGDFCDLVWSDPAEDIDCWTVSPRGAGWLFGESATEHFLHHNKLSLVARAHQLVHQGYKYHFSNQGVVTVWSAPNYCYRCGNAASILTVGEDDSRTFSTFEETNPQHASDAQAPVYFM
ncbi:Phytochrome-associated serine/threonine-protein phosphatase 3 [Diplonema papillatum]|nr:Phytochrome-associated serine/threonine-protein phosphatase 3 [Diplonema papillatum]